VAKSRLEEQVRLLENQLKSFESQNQLLQSKNIELENTLMQYTKLPTGDNRE
jgi:chaperonin cofactor prefoldin